jgi:CMP/dCMP kinase
MPYNVDHPPLTIAIDGYSSCGKSTLAKQVAKALGYVFVDSGAMYRAVTLYFIEHSVDLEDDAQVHAALEKISITFENLEGKNTTFLNGVNVENEIRSLLVSNLVSEVSTVSAIRRKLVDLQRNLAGTKGIVMDGRDIGTVVFPNADIKFFLTADPMVRAQRRYDELLVKNQQADIHEVIENLAHRDEIDENREDSPLRQAADAILLDNTHFSISDQFDFVMDIIQKKIALSAQKI